MLFADTPYPPDVAALAEALRADHVIVQETRGSGDAAGAEDRISKLVSQLPFAAYVAVIDSPPDVDAGTGASDYLATALSRRIGEPGLYVVSADSFSTAVRMVGTGWDQTDFDLEVYTDRDAVSAAAFDNDYSLLAPTVSAETAVATALAADPDAGYDPQRRSNLSASTIEGLADRQRAIAPYEAPDYDWGSQGWDTGKRWLVGTLVAAGLLAVILQSLRGWPGWRRRRASPESVAAGLDRPEAPDLAEERAAARTRVTTLAEQLAAAPATGRTEVAALAREVAEPLLDSSDVLDVIGAEVLARAGLRELAIDRGGARDPFRACFLEPRHKSADRTLTWRFGDADVEVPVCRACHHDVEVKRAPTGLVLGTRLRPYYEGDTVWARTGFGALTTDLADLARQVSAARRGAR